MSDGDRVYPVDHFVIHHAVTPTYANYSDGDIINIFSNFGKAIYNNGAINPRHYKPNGELTYTQAHAALRPYTLDGNKYGYRWTWLLQNPFGNVVWGAGNWAVNQRAINLEVCMDARYADLPDKALMLIADTLRPHDEAIGGALKLFGHSQVSQAPTQCPARLLPQVDKLVDMLNNPRKWNEILFPAPPPPVTATPKPTPTPVSDKPVIKYEKYDKPKFYITKAARASIWDFNKKGWEFAQKGSVPHLDEDGGKNVITIVGHADHENGARYLMTRYAMGTYDPRQPHYKPAHYNGINEKDLLEWYESKPEPAPQPAPQPPQQSPATEPDPTPETTPETPPATPQQPDSETVNEKEDNNMVKNLYDLLISGNQKAVVAFLVPSIVGLIGYGVTGDMTVNEALTVVITGVLTSVGVWLKANRTR